MSKNEEVRQVIVKINIEDTAEEYINNLILGLVRAGYNCYLDYENRHVCFEGWSDELIEEIKK